MKSTVLFLKISFKSSSDALKVVDNVLNFSRFWLRDGTLAEKKYKSCDFISGDESKKRSEKIKNSFEKIAIKNNQKWINWQGEVRVIEKVGKGIFKCRNSFYKPIIVKGNFKIGEILNVKIVKTNWKLFYGKTDI